MDCKADSPKLDLKLNLSPPGPHPQVESPDRSVSSMQLSPRGSCVSSESSYETLRSPSSPEATSMMLVGCPRCLMYVMLSDSEESPKCPKCKSTVLLDFFHVEKTKNSKK